MRNTKSEWIRLQLISSAGLFKDRHPQIKELLIDLKFHDFDTDKIITSRVQTLKSESSAYVAIDCPLHECISGGFDLTEILAEGIRDRKSIFAGSLCCNGWQDLERVNQHRCLCKLSYKITIEYYI